MGLRDSRAEQAVTHLARFISHSLNGSKSLRCRRGLFAGPKATLNFPDSLPSSLPVCPSPREVQAAAATPNSLANSLNYSVAASLRTRLDRSECILNAPPHFTPQTPTMSVAELQDRPGKQWQPRRLELPQSSFKEESSKFLTGNPPPEGIPIKQSLRRNGGVYESQRSRMFGQGE